MFFCVNLYVSGVFQALLLCLWLCSFCSKMAKSSLSFCPIFMTTCETLGSATPEKHPECILKYFSCIYNLVVTLMILCWAPLVLCGVCVLLLKLMNFLLDHIWRYESLALLVVWPQRIECYNHRAPLFISNVSIYIMELFYTLSL